MIEIAVIASWLASAPSLPEPVGPPAADYELRWSAPAACPDAAQIERRIRALTVGRQDGEGTMIVEGVVTASDDGFALALTTTLRGETGRREVASTVCSSLADTVAIVVAVSLDPAVDVSSIPDSSDDADDDETDDGARVPTPTEPDPEEAPALEPVPAPDSAAPAADPGAPAATSPDRAPVRGPRPAWLLRGGLGIERGVLPGATAGLRVAVGLGWKHARVLAEGTYFTPRRTRGPGDATVRYQQGSAALVGCGVLIREAWSVPLCAGLEAGGLRAAGLGGGARGASVTPWLGPLLRAGVVRRLRRGGLWVDAEAVGRGIGGRVSVDDALVFRQWPLSLRLLAGFEIAWR